MRLYHFQFSGTLYGMGYAHGRKCDQYQAKETISFFALFLKKVMSFGEQPQLVKSLKQSAYQIISGTIERSLIENIPQDTREILRGFSDGSKIPLDLVNKAVVMPDLYMYLLGRRQSLLKMPTLSLGCTSAVINDENGFFHARNLDFPGGSSWLSFPSVIEYAPARSQRYVSVVSMGVESPGITSMNESGITLSLNINYSKDVSSRGFPITTIGSEIIRYAKNLGDVVRIAKEFPVVSGWSFLVGSSREGNACLIEMAASKRCIYFMESKKYLLRTNHYQGEDLRKSEYWISPRRKLDTHARNQLGCANMEARRDVISDPSGVSQVHTLTSVVMDPIANKVSVATGPSPLAENDRIVLDVFGPFAQEVTEYSSETNDSKLQAKRLFGKAYESYFPDHDLLACIHHLSGAHALDPEPWKYPFLLAVLYLKVGSLRLADELLQKSLLSPGDQDSLALRQLYLGRTMDLQKNRTRALEIYGKILKTQEFQTRHAQAKAGIRKAWSVAKTQRLFLDFTISDVIDL